MKPQIVIKSGVSTGKLKTIDIIAKNVTNVRAIKLSLRFNPLIVKLKKATWVGVSSGGSMAWHANEKGEVILSWFGYPMVNMVHNKPIIKLQFQRIKKGVSFIEVMEDISDFACRLMIDNKDYPDDKQTYKNGKITFK